MKEQIDLLIEDIHLDDQLVWSFQHCKRTGWHYWPFHMQNTMEEQNGQYADRWHFTLV